MEEKTLEILAKASEQLKSLDSNLLDVLELSKPPTMDYAIQLAKVISKLSPLLGNMIEFSTVDLLNKIDFPYKGKWIRQDPGFPDALFLTNEINPNPGIEIKAWFPMATEITARFKDSIKIFENNNIDVALIAWLPEHVIWGKPKIIDVLVVSGKSVAEARDNHYHNPPYYIVFEPEDTSQRTQNLQQTNTNGYKLQEDRSDVQKACSIVDSWGTEGKKYSPDYSYQQKLHQLLGSFIYRLDTNYAKIDRIEHKEIEKFKQNVLNTKIEGRTINDWIRIFNSNDNKKIEEALSDLI